MIPENIKMSNHPAVRDHLTFPVSLHLFRVLVECSAAIIASDLTHANRAEHKETFLEHPSAPLESTRPVCSGMLHGRNPIAKCDGTVFSRTGKLVARSDEVNTDPRFARTSSTWKFSISQHSMVVPERHQISGTAFR